MRRLDKIYLGTNTKMYKSIADTVEFLKRLDDLTADISRNLLELFVIPSYTALDQARRTVKEEYIKLGAQNMCWEDEGQFTGEISPLMLKEIGINIIEIGHSERRHIMGETDEIEKKKVSAALRHGFTPLLCIGETLEQKNYKISDEILKIQLKVGLNEVTEQEAKSIWIAYEPVWAIGVNGIPADEGYANEKHGIIKDTLIAMFGKDIGSDIPVLYGGSVNPQNAEPLIKEENIDGLFIGRSAWQADNFYKIIQSVLPLFKEKRKIF
ncbi:MAG: triose-phosphate isomerase [Anaerolineaceae bacterium]|nr:MAG: triose-phosphate isomerase [Anaerolineaceae bacterium]